MVKYGKCSSIVMQADASIVGVVPLRRSRSNCPKSFASRMQGRHECPLGELWGLKSFGADLITLEPEAVSALQQPTQQVG